MTAYTTPTDLAPAVDGDRFTIRVFRNRSVLCDDATGLQLSAPSNDAAGDEMIRSCAAFAIGADENGTVSTFEDTARLFGLLAALCSR